MGISSDRKVIKAKLKAFGTKSALQKAAEETKELAVAMEVLLGIWSNPAIDEDKPALLATAVSNVAEEYADVTIAVYDTFRRLWPTVFAEIVEVKRRMVYDVRLPKLIEKSDTDA
jgi:hypothetical protein